MTTPTPTPRKGKDPLSALVAGVEQMLSELDEDQWNALVARVRPPADPEKSDPAAPKTDDAAYPASWGFTPKAASK
ncbi:hypothetical protein QEN35_20965 [Gordonia alkanivorans]|uniref:hypothetical protein n=1 Tax=Gordonia alkanivorans TaxID=84096 RepID=UPI001F4DF8B9|nr:hypothetical protein [Gordonia alkanivorans]MDH3026831.1 hypothetical protein [Gordonia alkanivorans]